MKDADNKVGRRIDEVANEWEGQVVSWRRQIHSRPELGWCEYVTSNHIINVLRENGWSVRYGSDVVSLESRLGLPDQDDLALAEGRALEAGVNPDLLNKIRGGATGVVAEMDTGKPGPTVAIRFDMDALALQESIDSSHLPNSLGFASIYPGVMHACGHDGHVAIGLGVGIVLHHLRNDLGGRFRLLFQPAEEGCRGAKSMVDAGALSDVDKLLGLHLGVKAKFTGQLFAAANGLLATHKFDVNFLGKPAHAGIDPESGRNALLAAASAALNIHAAPRHGGGNSRVNIGRLVAGDARNIVPARAYMQLETRGDDTHIEEHVYHHAMRCIEGSARSYEVDFSITPMGWAPSATCDYELAQVVLEAAKLVPQISESRDVLNSYGGSDDFSIMIDAAQRAGANACYICLGSKLASGHHQQNFDFDENSLVIGVKLLCHTVKLLTT